MHAIECCKQGCERTDLACSHEEVIVGKGESTEQRLCKQHLHDVNDVHAHLLHPVQTCDLISQLAKKLVSSPDTRNRIYYLRDGDCDNIFL